MTAKKAIKKETTKKPAAKKKIVKPSPAPKQDIEEPTPALAPSPVPVVQEKPVSPTMISVSLDRAGNTKREIDISKIKRIDVSPTLANAYISLCSGERLLVYGTPGIYSMIKEIAQQNGLQNPR
ncbi:MAG: hypothetical protein EKK55_17375 [Rhodocyclaceae bacterium]|nr:MAG: hypothetical protein EKK55_17375 [Rhodocyclaceae bacterium]